MYYNGTCYPHWKCTVQLLNWATNGHLTKSNETLQVLFIKIKMISTTTTWSLTGTYNSINDVKITQSRKTHEWLVCKVVKEHQCLKQVCFLLSTTGKLVLQQETGQEPNITFVIYYNWTLWYIPLWYKFITTVTELRT